MIPSVEEVKTYVASLLGDPTARKFTAAKLQPFFELSYEELTGEMARYHVPKQKRVVNYVIPAGTTTLSPLTVGISNFGELIRMEERAYRSSDRYTLVRGADRLPQRTADECLHEYEWYDDSWHFVGATQSIDCLITYYDSGAAPTTGSCGIDGSKNFLAYRTAAAAGIPAGNLELGVEYDKMARGAYRDGSGGFMHTLLQAMITSEQKVQMQLPCYRAGNFYLPIAAMGLMAGDGGTDVGAPSTATLTGTIDGVNDTFTLATAPLRLFLFLNGQLLTENTHYTLSGVTITMSPGYVPQVGDQLRAEVW